jgi:hypothetical protein
MVRFLLMPLVVIQLFLMFGYSADGANSCDIRVGWDPNGAETASPGWDPLGGTPTGSSDVGPGWDPNGSNAGSSSGGTDASPGWDPNGGIG